MDIWVQRDGCLRPPEWASWENTPLHTLQLKNSKKKKIEFHRLHPMAPIWFGPELTSHFSFHNRLQDKSLTCSTSQADLWQVIKGSTDPGVACEVWVRIGRTSVDFTGKTYLTLQFSHIQFHHVRWMTWEKAVWCARVQPTWVFENSTTHDRRNSGPQMTNASSPNLWDRTPHGVVWYMNGNQND